MAIEGLRRVEPQTFNRDDEIGVMVDALERVGLVRDSNRDRVTESVTADLGLLTANGETGESYPWVSEYLVTLGEVVHALDSGEYANSRDYDEALVDHRLWTPGAHPDGYDADDFGNLEPGQPARGVPAHVRQAIHNPASEAEPLLHFLDLPFDDKYRGKAPETQLEALAKAKQEYERAHEGFTVTPLDSKAIAMITLMRRIKGQAMPLEWGCMRDATLPRRVLKNNPVVGAVYSRGEQLNVGWSTGVPKDDVGLGLSVGPQKIERQPWTGVGKAAALTQ